GHDEWHEPQRHAAHGTAPQNRRHRLRRHQRSAPRGHLRRATRRYAVSDRQALPGVGRADRQLERHPPRVADHSRPEADDPREQSAQLTFRHQEARSKMGFLSGKRALIVGVATDRSIAWGIAQAMHREGAELAFSYVNDKFKERVEPLAQSLGSRLTMPLDVTSDEQIDAAFDLLKREWRNLDIVVHAVAYAPREALAGGFVDSTTRESFRVAHDISSYSFTALARGARPLMTDRQGALLTLSYLGAVRSVPSYNVMGLAKASL